MKRHDPASNSLAPEHPELPIVPVGSNQRPRIERQAGQRDLTRARSCSEIAPCSASHSSSGRRPVSSFNWCSTAKATNAETLRPEASAASRVRCANSGSKDTDSFLNRRRIIPPQ